MISKRNLMLTMGLLLGAVVAVLWPKSGSHVTDDLVGQTLLQSQDLEKIDAVKIERAEKTLNLQKTSENRWFIAGEPQFPADATKIAKLFDDLGKVKFQRLVPGAKAEDAELGLDLTTNVQFLVADKSVLNLRLGNKREKGGQYVNLAGQSLAYLVSDTISIDTDAETWENKILLQLKKENLKRISFLDIKPDLVFAREKPTDKLAVTPEDKNLKLDDSKLEEIASTAEQIRFVKRRDVSNVDARDAFKNPRPMQLETFDGKSYKIIIGNSGAKDKELYFVKILVESSPAIREKEEMEKIMAASAFEISGYDAKKMMKTRKDFK